MALRCFLFSSDEGTAAIVRQILSGLDVEAESCSNAVTAAERITNQSFQIVIIDWDQQPEAGVLLSTARERKASERPITLAIVSDDASAPQALRAGANSLLRKPVVVNQAKETLTTARDLLRAKQGLPGTLPHAAAAAASASAPSSSAAVLPGAPVDQSNAKSPRVGFLEPSASGSLFEAETKAPRPVEVSLPAPEEPSTEPESTTAADETRKPEESSTESRGLEWYMKSRVAGEQQPPKPAAVAPSRGNPELLGYEQTHSNTAPRVSSLSSAKTLAPIPIPERAADTKRETALFSYMQKGSDQPDEPSPASSGWKKRAIAGAFVLAAFAIVVAPQAPWHAKLRSAWHGGRQSIHGWLYPQPVTPAQAPVAHENFTPAGDEYKLPVPETIPDATTDPSQIQVLPVVDPTAKKASGESSPDQTALPADGTTSGTDAPAQSPSTHAPELPQSQPVPSQSPSPAPLAPAHPAPVTVSPAVGTARPDTTTVISAAASSPAPKPALPRAPVMPANVPQSLKSQLTSMTPYSSGNKAAENALPSIEPVNVPEAQERALLTDQPIPAYPANAKGQQGTVTLQVLIGRDGTVQDAKFLQGSLVFARSAIDGVKLWKFKPYTMNTRAVSVQTQLTLKFKPAP
jgi:TonB family protein